MFEAAAWRIAWKEYRTQRPLWLAIVVLTLLVQFGYQIAATVGGGDVSEQALFAIAMGAAAVYALGCGATLFATERETGTYEFQRGLPLAWRALFVGKAGFGAASVVALAVLLWSVTIVMAGGRLPAWRDSGQLWGGGLLAAWEVFAWSLLFSLRLDRPLVAAVLGVLVPSVFVHVAAPAVVGFDYHNMGLRHYLAIVPWRVGIALAVSAADLWLASRWLRESGETYDSDADLLDDAPVAGSERMTPALTARLQGGFWRLVWQHWFHSRWTMIAISLGYISVVVLAMQTDGSNTWHVVPLVWLVPAAALWGVSVFLADQRRHAYRFFAEHGMNPRQVWLSRQIVGAAPVVVGLAAALIFGALCPQYDSGRTLPWPPTETDASFAGAAICCVLLAYAAGQACSMFFRSPILALVGTAFSAVVLVFWVVLMRAAGIAWSWSVLPIPAVLLVATWRRAPDWMLEKTSWSARWRLGSTLAIPAAILATAVILVRIYEIPRVEPGFDVSEFLKPLTTEQLETLQLYERAEASFRGMTRNVEPAASNASEKVETAAESPLQEQRRWASENQEAITLLLKASRGVPCGIWDPAHGRGRLAGWFSALDHILLASAAVLVADGKLDDAWERYVAALRIATEYRIRGREFVYREGDRIETAVCEQLPRWAAHPQQTPQRIKAAIRELETLSRDVPSATSIIKDYYVEAVRPLDGDFRRVESDDPKSVRMLRLTYALLPWETARARRLASFVTAHQLARIQSLEQSINRPDATIRQRLLWNAPDPRWHDHLQFESWMGTTPLASRGFWSLGPAVWLDDRVLEQEMYRRVVRIQLVLLAWRKEHGQFPQKLDDLVGPYFQQLPLDPYCGQPFRYEPQGWPRETRWLPLSKFYPHGPVRSLEESTVAVPAECPFLWTPGDGASLAASQRDEPRIMPPMPDGSRVYSGYLFVVDPQYSLAPAKAAAANE